MAQYFTVTATATAASVDAVTCIASNSLRFFISLYVCGGVRQLLHLRLVDELQYLTEGSEGSDPQQRRWVCKRRCPRQRKQRSTSNSNSNNTITDAAAAVGVLQGFARCIIARRRLLQQANEVYRRILDADTSYFYYANVRTGETSWTKSSCYLHPASEPPLLQLDDDAHASRRSPRTNRLT